MIVLDGENQVLGRLCSVAAKKALLGEQVIIVNAEKALISGERLSIIQENMQKLTIRNKGNYRLGPFHQKRPDRFVRKKVRGMLPFKKTRGKEAYKRIQVYMGVPEYEIKKRYDIDISKVEMIKPKETEKPLRRKVTVEQLCKSIGGGM